MSVSSLPWKQFGEEKKKESERGRKRVTPRKMLHRIETWSFQRFAPPPKPQPHPTPRFPPLSCLDKSNSITGGNCARILSFLLVPPFLFFSFLTDLQISQAIHPWFDAAIGGQVWNTPWPPEQFALLAQHYWQGHGGELWQQQSINSFNSNGLYPSIQ